MKVGGCVVVGSIVFQLPNLQFQGFRLDSELRLLSSIIVKYSPSVLLCLLWAFQFPLTSQNMLVGVVVTLNCL